MSISQQDFGAACKELRQLWQATHEQRAWQNVQTFEDITGRWLRITRRLGDSNIVSQPHETGDTAIGEEDEEALPPPPAKCPLIVYDIIHSPAYQVPILYITFKDPASTSRGPPPPEEVYQMLVPPSHRKQIDAVGVMGALSMTDHPITRTPAYFVHPCRTTDAMGAMAGDGWVKPVEYLIRWIGLVGQSVGLDVPVELAQAIGAVADA